MNDNNNQNENSSENGIIAKITAFITFLKNFISSGEESTSGNLLQNKKVKIAVGVVLLLIVFKLLGSSNYDSRIEMNVDTFVHNYNNAMKKIKGNTDFNITSLRGASAYYVFENGQEYYYNPDFKIKIDSFKKNDMISRVGITLKLPSLNNESANHFIECCRGLIAAVHPELSESQREKILSDFKLNNVKTAHELMNLEMQGKNYGKTYYQLIITDTDKVDGGADFSISAYSSDELNDMVKKGEL